ncbi:MAG TPA: MerR family transcriptional regulator [Planctomycetota bacterium]
MVEPAETALDELLDIADLASEAGVSSRTLRYYGEIGLIRPDGRGAGGRRLYGAVTRERLAFIQRLKGLGLTLDEIGELNRSFAEGATPQLLSQLESLLLQHMETVHERIEELRGLHSHLGRYLDRIRTKRQAQDDRA